MIEIGTEAPDFELPSNETTPEGKPGKKIKLSDYRGKKNVVLAFYPLDFSPVCSGEHNCLRDDISQLESANAQVLGISVDSHWAHHAFAKQLNISYPLLADFHPKGGVATKYGLFEADKGLTSRRRSSSISPARSLGHRTTGSVMRVMTRRLSQSSRSSADRQSLHTART